MEDLGKGFDSELGLKYIDVTPDGGRAVLEIHDKLLQPWGIVHGGVYCSLIETLASLSGQVWLAENGGGHVVGHVALTREGPGEARLRWFLLLPEARGQGVGRRLLDGLLQTADAAGHERITLTTFSELEAAAHLYRATGFERMSASPLEQWGRSITMEVYERRRPAGSR